MKSSILLEAGTGELELLKFKVDNNDYGINVLKVKEIIRLTEVVPSPGSVPAIAGKAILRDKLVSVVDLKMVLKNEKIEDYTKGVGLLCQFNQMSVVFVVDNVVGIKRFNWAELDNKDVMGTEAMMIGSIIDGDSILTLLDFESIIINLSPENMYYNKVESEQNIEVKRKRCHVLLADDSRVVRELLKASLTNSGYDQLTFFNNGQDAYDYLIHLKEKKGENFKERVDIIITDIEMPIMDGYTLTRKIKEDEILSELPVIIFSSLITDELYHKGKQVGAEAQISKPSLNKLVEIVDQLVGIK
ncbi:MAG: chemotaxis protein [Cellulosilyticaceae bacterium]